MATVKRTWLQDPYKNDVNFWTNVVSVQTGLWTSSKALEKFKGCRIKCALGQTRNHQEFSFFLKNVGSRLRASCSEVNDYFSSNTNVALKMELYWFLASIQLLIWFPPSQTFETKSGKFKLDVSWNSFVFPVIVAVSSKRNHPSTFNKWKKNVQNRKQIKKNAKNRQLIIYMSLLLLLIIELKRDNFCPDSLNSIRPGFCQGPLSASRTVRLTLPCHGTLSFVAFFGE